ncbi:MAG: CDP-diacylglycerol--serine O-phosphatidyltransferase [Deltaproteobacteria bacterium]|nr:CDP-diacylglycerol--serine O-phosphatidyltransferase [Deltaproteobacteria bacterium]
MQPARQRRRPRPRFPLAFNLRRAAFVLPNLFTLSSVFCGFYAVVLASGDAGPQQLYRASVAIFFGIFFDMFDGRIARLTRTQSAFGVELDSLADIVTFGVAPGLIVYKWGLSELGLGGAVVGFVYVGCGALRLARFNILATRSPGPMKYFIGVPIPLAAGVLVSLVMLHQRTIADTVTRPAHIMALVLIVSYLMISKVRYRTFKDLKLTAKSFTIVFTLLVLFAVIALRVRPTFALVAYFWGYLTLGLIEEIIFFRRRRREERVPSPATGPPADAPAPHTSDLHTPSSANKEAP